MGCRWTVDRVPVSSETLVTTVIIMWQVTVLMTTVSLVRSQQSYGPVELEGVDPLTLSWNQIHWLVKDQIKEVEELKAEHDEIYNEIAGNTIESDNEEQYTC